MKHLTKIPVLAAVMLLMIGGLATGEEPKTAERIVPEIRASRINPHRPVIDGQLDDEIWNSSKLDFATGFTQREPDDGQPATDSTKVAVRYDDESIFFAFWCYDSEPDKITRQLVRRDRYSESDGVVVRLDPFHDHQTGYEFNLSAAGVQRDFRIYNDNHMDDSWNGVWNSAVKMQPWGWSAEMEIPYHCLRFTDKQVHEWGIDFVRLINRKDEGSRWAYTPVSKGGFVSNFGHLTGLEGISPVSHLEILPYAVSSFETEPKEAGNLNGRDFMGNSGVDIKYGLSSNLTLDATINPDFGQVELDQPVLNLSAYESWFPERRPFFVEGADLFQAEYRMFYSRRIGRSPSADVDDDDRLFYTDYPQATTILGAAKLSGKLAGGTSIAFLAAVTDEEKARYGAEQIRLDTVYGGSTVRYDTIAVDTVFREGTVEPMTSYSVFRVKQDILANSSIGGILTLVSHGEAHPISTGGFDWRLRSNNGVWSFRGQSIFSRVAGEPVGFATDAVFEKEAGQHFRGALGMVVKDPHLNINRLGYTDRNDYRQLWSWVQYRTSDDWWIVRNSWNNFNAWIGENYRGEEIEKGGNFNTFVQFTNYWSLGGGTAIQAEKYSDLETRGRETWEWPQVPTYSWWLNLNTDTRKKVSLTFNPGGGTDRGGWWWANYVGAEYRPTSNLEFDAGINYNRVRGITRWVDNPDDTTTIFANLDQDKITIHGGAAITFTRNLSMQLSARGLISGLDYQGYRQYLGGGNYGVVIGDETWDGESLDNDYNWSSLNSTLLVRWEYRPGSTVYMVWTRSRPDYDDSTNAVDFGRDFDRFFSAGATNVFMIKTSYWMNI